MLCCTHYDTHKNLAEKWLSCKILAEILQDYHSNLTGVVLITFTVHNKTDHYAQLS